MSGSPNIRPTGFITDGERDPQAGRGITVMNKNAPRELDLRQAPKMVKLKNRAEKGYVKVFMAMFDSEMYPEGVDPENKSTWLQPGEEMIVSIEVATHVCGNLLNPKFPDAEDVISRYGGWQLEGQNKAPGRGAPMRVIGPPIGLPDLVVEFLDGRGKVAHSVSLWDAYVGSRRYMKRTSDETLEDEKALLEDRIALYLPDGELVDVKPEKRLARA